MASEYLLSLINDVLDMRKIDHNDMKLFEESVNLRAIIENCRDILETKAAEQEIELDITGLESATSGTGQRGTFAAGFYEYCQQCYQI